MSRIDVLPDHIDLGAYRDKWIAIGLSCEPADWEAAEAAIADAYRVADLAPPEHFVRTPSPWAAIQKIAELTGKPPEFGSPCYGQHQTWLSFYDVLCPLIDEHRLDPHIAAAKAVGWWWPFEYAVIMSDRPELLHLDDTGRLHCEDGPAMKYRDGYSLYRWHGIQVPEDVILHPENITRERIDAETNAETRRVMIERFGMERYLEGIEPIDSAEDEGGQLMQLYAVDDLRRLRLRNSTTDPDGTVREYVLRVPGPEFDGDLPPGYDPNNVWHARNWTCDMEPNARFGTVS